ncbi:MAG: hypothetical protein K2F96_06575 [Muribaculaceae bacterium]|nr:hypothetical protein [Muribaculaceae bacterium]
MKQITAVAVMVLTVLAATAASPDKQIVFHSAGDGMLVFVKPRKMAKTATSSASKPLDYDITLSTQSDTVSVTFTLVSKSASLHIDSTSVNSSLRYVNERLYVEPKSKNWIYRLRFKMPQDDFEATFCGDNPLELSVDNCGFQIPKKKQPKEAEICRTAVNIIEMNRK